MNPAVICFDIFRQNIHVLDLAFDYLSIDPSEKQKIIDSLEQKAKENPDIKITDIFRQENLISDEDIDCLSIFDNHLQTLCQDSQFGKLAIANHFASKADVTRALEQQKDYFKKYRINIKLGDILVENNIISHTDRVSILLTQNRIKDENLLDALNDIGATPLEKEAVNKRFGVLAIKEGLATIDQVNAALDIQKTEQKTTGKPRFLGHILQETASLSEDDILTILSEQAQFEKRKLDLEKALYTAKSEIKIAQKLNKIFSCQISRDGVEVFAKKLTDTHEDILTYEFLIWLKRAGIRFGIVKNTIIEDFIQNTDKNTPVLVAKGYPVEPCMNETVEFYFENEQEKSQSVQRGTVLARIIPGKEGRPGKDVLGYLIKPDKPAACILNAERGVIRKDSVFIAVTDGMPVLKNGISLMVEPMTEKSEIQIIKGSISEDTQETYQSAIVELKANLTPDAILRCHSLIRQGDLIGRFICTGDIDVKGNIGTDQIQKGQESIQETDITCQGSVKVSKSIINARIRTGGELVGVNSKISGSRIMAYSGMTLKDVVMGKNNQPSILQFGLKPGDKSPVIDHTIETKMAELPVLRKEKEIEELTKEYETERLQEENHLTEQQILKNIIEIIEAPELYQHEGLENKLKYLYSLPDFSSVKSFYLRLPETESALAFCNQIFISTAKLSQDKLLEDLRKKMDPEPEHSNEDEPFIPRLEQIETQFKARRAAIEQEIKNNSQNIEKIENEIRELSVLKEKLNAVHLKSVSKATATVKIKNQCEKGTIIKGRIARLVLEKSIYKVEFKEVTDPRTGTVSIVINAY
ncbi:MAG: DUF342 domain-containing protein [Proteobacteria bacterium]|nr:DUF342 domain-containing protein [Pseudomonadota bacterium]MBU1386626.1 DUF342 domain-containing protein [Pseudomonadota bacterium]MBU1542370.1 DUF342 domain-containing protein [Pseudomonadota bacterium]MBU2480520.1 DUF342 domain-containing protein [Pseudomonadota bacterium]